MKTQNEGFNMTDEERTGATLKTPYKTSIYLPSTDRYLVLPEEATKSETKTVSDYRNARP